MAAILSGFDLKSQFKVHLVIESLNKMLYFLTRIVSILRKTLTLRYYHAKVEFIIYKILGHLRKDTSAAKAVSMSGVVFT